MNQLFNICRQNALQSLKTKLLQGRQPCRGKLSDVIKQLDREYDKFIMKGSLSLLAKHLDDVLFEELKIMDTPMFESTLMDCVQSGFKLPDSKIGVYAPDHEAYWMFGRLFNLIIKDIHGFTRDDLHPARDFGRPEILKDIDPHNHFILFTRMRVDRNVQGYPFTPRMSEFEYKELGETTERALRGLRGDLKGEYYHLYDLSEGQQKDLMAEHMFKAPNRFMEPANMCRFLPTGRAIFYNKAKTFSVWVNFEDHLKIVSMQQGGHFGEVYRRLIKAIELIEAKLPSYHHCRLGYLTACPSKLGSALRVSVLIKLVKLPQDMKTFQKLLDEFDLTVRGTHGEYTPVVRGVYDITNRRCLGVNEYEAMRAVYDGANEIMRAEKCLKVPVRN